MDGQWWNVVEYKEVNSGIRCYFENRSTALIPHAEADERIKVQKEVSCGPDYEPMISCSTYFTLTTSFR